MLFGNAGAFNNLLSDALKRLQLRLKKDEFAEKDRLTVEDVSGNEIDSKAPRLRFAKISRANPRTAATRHDHAEQR